MTTGDGRYRLSDESNTWYRRDGHEWLFCAGPCDESPPALLWSLYDAKCPSCYLGHGHTEDLHRVRVLETETRQRDHKLAMALNDPPASIAVTG